MTKKDYIAIAKAIDSLDELDGSTISRVDLIMKLSDYFKLDNPRFDEGKFVEACQKTDHPIIII